MSIVSLFRFSTNFKNYSRMGKIMDKKILQKQNVFSRKQNQNEK
jgi:hypothetical protein